jgi:Domain of unknown function (DUF4157)
LRGASGRPYACAVDSAETEAHAEVDAARAAPQREPEAPERYHDVRPPLERLASDVGNRGFGQILSRMGDGGGILAGGLVHPDVEAAIAATRGSGRALDRSVAAALSPSLGTSLDGVRVHTGDGAAALARAVTARAFTVGNDIYFGRGEYRPGTSEGNELIAHEVAHTIQQRGAPMDGPLTVSQPGDALEREAEAAARDAVG